MRQRVELSFRSVGRQALYVEVADVAAAQAVYAAIRDAVESGAMPAPREVIPAARTVLLDGVDAGDWHEYLFARRVESGAPARGREVRIPVRYGGPDLADVGAAWGCDARDVPVMHQAATYTVVFCGFAPGFAYCVGDPARPPVPRRADPRTRVPAGSVGFAGDYCGIYPNEMPGGWQLVGTTELVLFDPARAEPALLSPGDRVKFEAES